MTSETPKVTQNGHYNVTEAARALGISRHTLYKHTRLRHIKRHFHKYTKTPFYLGSDIIRFWGAEY